MEWQPIQARLRHQEGFRVGQYESFEEIEGNTFACARLVDGEDVGCLTEEGGSDGQFSAGAGYVFDYGSGFDPVVGDDGFLEVACIFRVTSNEARHLIVERESRQTKYGNAFELNWRQRFVTNSSSYSPI